MDKFLNSNKMMIFFNYVYWFIMCNLLIGFLNFPLLFFFKAFGFNGILSNLPIFLLCALFFFPAFTAGLFSMGKLIREKDIFIFRDFFSSYKKNFIQALLLGLILSLIFLGFYMNYSFFSTSEMLSFVSPLFVVGLVIIILLIPTCLILLSRFEFTILNLLKTSLVILFTRLGCTFGNIISLLFVIMLFEIIPSLALLFIASLLCFLLMFINKELLFKLENISN